MDEHERSEADEWLRAELGVPDSPKSWIYYEQKKRGSGYSRPVNDGVLRAVIIGVYAFLIFLLFLFAGM